MFEDLRVALAFLTRLPVAPPAWDPSRWKASLDWYPVAGLVVGLIMATVMALTSLAVTPAVAATLTIIAGCAVSGGLHLDGLADSADAWMGAPGDRERTLRILKDVHAGSAAVWVVGLVLLLKVQACAGVATTSLWGVILMPVVGRMMPPLLFATTPYARPEGGLGSGMEGYVPGGIFVASVATLLLLTVMTLGVLHAGGVVLALALVFGLCRHAMMRRLGGTTGDTAGALVELSEAVWLLAWMVG